MGGLRVTRELVQTEPGITVPVLTLSPAGQAGAENPKLVFAVASDGIAKIVERRRDLLATGLAANFAIALVEVRGTGASSPGADRGQQGSATSLSATQLMLGEPLLTGQLRDLRAAWRHVRRRFAGIPAADIYVVGGAGFEPLAADAPFAHPRRIEGRPRECEPTGPLLALLLALYEDEVQNVTARRGLVSFRGVLESPFVQVPHDAMVPGLLREVDLPDLVAALAPRTVQLVSMVDALGRHVPAAAASEKYDYAVRRFTEIQAGNRLNFSDAAW
jgi:hypothetical protein